jgi:adenosylcobinamide kinase/adenosylcobinamide-phosphate guanylyltransferase
VDALLATRAHAIVVGEEAGWGIVPEYPAGRVFRDLLGRAQQRLATGSNATYLVVAGFALDLNVAGRPIDRA